MFCTQCGQSVADGSSTCSHCGAILAVAPPPAGGPGVATGATPGTRAARASSFSFDAARWSQTERITLVASVVLFVSLFLPWFTYNYGLGTVSVDGLWHGWMYLTLLLCLGTIGFLVAKAGFSPLPFALPMAEERLLLMATGANAVLSILAFLFKPGGIGFTGIGWGFGAFLGLIAAIVAAAPTAVPAIRARRAGH
ncbi:MAG TPA: zinc ribbon domain-containing protein [Acidimicrobiales bacterium]|nr:zinc ribbon domain-containing protein [Acidimicrobiales bacterium]